ncbi:hypothetical protein GP486_002626 [Trichoglossum hirsutum]|uniref:Dol-P-Glc:Glc(2)Man(9)GlcNAc(2)-PP-Dol alpha-1,2-glucosyltransferase n=1 Tax=Trichoglossum hirsutum TaxID=265104 RepID=A0A9P8LEE9_9PEZI|nr:hypothetical protein GP486_002626 [Trichoglossum hirsutum]
MACMGSNDNYSARPSITKYFGIFSCETLTLRLQNCIAVVIVIPLVAGRLHRLLQTEANTKGTGKSTKNRSSEGSNQAFNFTIHTALNIALFPPLFFFSALYYTEPWSIFWVLLAHPVLRSSKSSVKAKGSLGRFLLANSFLVAQGVIALLFRQTNISWIVVFYGGLEAVQSLESTAIDQTAFKARDLTIQGVAIRSWESGHVYDPPVHDAYFQGKIVLLAVSPYLVLLGAFGAFTIWNGGIVLGDKSNHVASLHLPQMLYIWPYIAFFSFPLIYPYLVDALPQACLPQFLRFSNKVRPRVSVALSFTGLMLCIVHFNTIVHPYLLADNRHYVFYVFRWILLRHRVAKYLVIPIYFVCGWATIMALGGTQVPTISSTQTDRSKGKGSGKGERGDAVRNRASFVIIWLTAAASSLVTAPLVEPRYFIMPWMMWRLYLPNSIFTSKRALVVKESRSRARSYLGAPFDRSSLWFETAWFLLVNSLTMYVFLYRGYEWPQEPGNVQRFMW